MPANAAVENNRKRFVFFFIGNLLFNVYTVIIGILGQFYKYILFIPFIYLQNNL